MENELKKMFFNSKKNLNECISVYKKYLNDPNDVSLLEKMKFGIKTTSEELYSLSSDIGIFLPLINGNSFIRGENIIFYCSVFISNKQSSISNKDKFEFLLKGETKFKKDLVISESNIKYLPDNITVCGTLTIRNCEELHYLPYNLTAKRIILHSNKIFSLPNCLNAEKIYISKKSFECLKNIPKHLNNKIIIIRTEY